MSAKVQRCIRLKIDKEMRKNRNAMMRDAMSEIMHADFITRLKFCWMVIKGVRK